MRAIRLVILSLTFLFGVSCAKIIGSAIENNPGILQNAIKKNPVAFMKTLQEADKAARESYQENAAKERAAKREDQFKNPVQFAMEADRPVLGDKNAPLTIVEYSDLQCPFCTRGSATMDKILKDYKGKVKLVFKHLPLEGKHPNARRGSEYFEAIAMLDNKQAFEFKKLVFANQRATYGSKDDVEKLFEKLTKDSGANLAKVKANLKDRKDKITQRINGDMSEAQKNGIDGTPGYLVNGVTIEGAVPYEEFKKVIDKWLEIKG